MKIVYFGNFLEEGLTDLGHDIFPLIISKDLDFTTAVKKACPDPDIILLEIWGQIIGKNFADCPFPLIAYCVDTCLNIFSQVHLLKLFTHIFVDQLSSVEELKKYDINAQWLPLCISKECFKSPVPNLNMVFLL